MNKAQHFLCSLQASWLAHSYFKPLDSTELESSYAAGYCLPNGPSSDKIQDIIMVKARAPQNSAEEEATTGHFPRKHPLHILVEDPFPILFLAISRTRDLKKMAVYTEQDSHPRDFPGLLDKVRMHQIFPPIPPTITAISVSLSLSLRAIYKHSSPFLSWLLFHFAGGRCTVHLQINKITKLRKP